MRFVCLVLLLTAALTIGGCGITRSPGYHAEIDGVLVLPETADPEQVTATLSYQHPRTHFWRYSDTYRFSGAYERPGYRRQFDVVYRELQIDGSQIVIRLDDEVFRDSRPSVLVEGEGIARGTVRVDFLHRTPIRDQGSIHYVSWSEFSHDLPAESEIVSVMFVEPSRVELDKTVE